MNVFLVAAIALVGATLLMLLRPWKGHRAEQEATARELNARISCGVGNRALGYPAVA